MCKLTFLLLLISGAASAQKSVLYNEHRQLIVDTSYYIDSVMYHNLPLIEKELLPLIYNRIKYPARSKYNNVNGTVIVRILINGYNYSYDIVKTTDEDFNPSVLLCLKNLSPFFSMSSPFPQNVNLSLYVPIKFEIRLKRYQQTLNKNHMVTIEFDELAPENSISDQDIIYTPKKP